MKFDAEKFRRIRKQKHLSMEVVAQRAGIVRRTLSTWEKQERTPSELKIRILAKILNISVGEISDLNIEYPRSDKMFSETSESWMSIANLTEECSSRLENEFIKKILQQQKQVRQVSTVVNAIISSMHSVFYVKDINLKYITANKAFLKNISFISSYDVSGKSDQDFFSIIEAKKNNKQDQEILSTGKSIKYEGHIPGSRKKRWGLISKLPIFNSEGKITGLIGSFVDITERKLSEAKSKELEEAISKVNECIWIASMDKNKPTQLKIAYINNAYEKITGIENKDFINNSSIGFRQTVNNSLKQNKALQLDAKNNKRIYQYRTTNVTDGSERIIREKVYNYKDNHYLGIITDITENIHLHTLNKLLEYSLNSIEYAFTIYSYTNRKYCFINLAKSKIFGYPIENFYNDDALEGLSFRVRQCVHKDYKESEERLFLNHSWPPTRVYKIVTPEGTVKNIEATVIQKNYDNEIFNIVIERDITSKLKNNSEIDLKILNMAKRFIKKGIDLTVISSCTDIPVETLKTFE